MIAEQIALKLGPAATFVMEMMFITSLVSDQKLPPPVVADPILVRLAFVGRTNKAFSLAAGTATGQRLALNLIGMESCEKLDRQPGIDVFWQSTHMSCGQVPR